MHFTLPSGVISSEARQPLPKKAKKHHLEEIAKGLVEISDHLQSRWLEESP
jgi:hypothetical protein